ncbi:MAG TPA: TonB-dependent receptor [Salinimicrobium sp.]|nr:TonB-dependent receptor [Salinimicrobium sp.]
MKKILFVAFLLVTSAIQAQQDLEDAIIGQLTDKDVPGEPLPFANVVIKGTSIGTMTDFDGMFILNNLSPGNYILVFSFVGYETLEIPVTVGPEKTQELQIELRPSAAALNEILITTVSRNDSEIALLLKQKEAITIKESIGAPELSKLGVSDAASATSKISGVSNSEASGTVFVRGLGDRYLHTTLNGLPIPSDDVERKNIDLGLFSTDIMQSVGITKTYSPEFSADQASGTIDISSRELIGAEELSLGFKLGFNTNAIGQNENFKTSANADDVIFGFYSGDLSSEQALTQQTWNTQRADFPFNSEFSITAGKRFGEKFEIFFTGAQSTSFSSSKGVFREFRRNYIQDSITDAENFSKTINTTGLLNFGYKINDKNELRATSLFINKLQDEVFEGGRNGEASIFEETEPAEGFSQFIRDQNIKQTQLWVNQLSGTHQITENNELNWAFGSNILSADEPNRIRNEVNFNDDLVQLGRTGGFQQRKSAQIIEDQEFNGFITDRISFFKNEKRLLDVSFGGNFRNKERDFASQFFGLEEITINSLNPSSIDDLSEVFTQENIDNGLLKVNVLEKDRYFAELNSVAAFASVNFHLEKFDFNFGARFQTDELNVHYDVGNVPGRIGSAEKKYENIYPSLNIKYELNDKNNFRLAASKTVTLPEFKEVSPFEYVSQTGQITRGNPNLEASNNYNFDVKWEFFPTSKQLVSLTGFYKQIQDPINKVQDRGSAGIYSYFNSGEKAEIYGIEIETKVNLLSIQNEAPIDLDFGFNASRMWHSQDLKVERNSEGDFIRTFRYKGLTETGLQGASDWISNASLNLETDSENEFMASLIANYASDKIYALGAPEIQTQSETFYNDAIVEQGFVQLDMVLSQNIGDHWNFKLSGKNLLNPEIKRTQKIKPSTTGIERTETVRSYTKGAVISFGVNYNF